MILKNVLCIFVFSMSFSVYGIDKDFALHDYAKTPLELLKIDVKHSSKKQQALEEVVSDVLSIVLFEAIKNAELQAIKESNNKKEFIDNFYFHLGGENNVLYQFYINNLGIYCSFIKENYDRETYQYFKKEYTDINTFNYILKIYWDNEVVPAALKIINESSGGKWENSITKEEKVLSVLAPSINSYLTDKQ